MPAVSATTLALLGLADRIISRLAVKVIITV